jgi:hypothetical protein
MRNPSLTSSGALIAALSFCFAACGGEASSTPAQPTPAKAETKAGAPAEHASSSLSSADSATQPPAAQQPSGQQPAGQQPAVKKPNLPPKIDMAMVQAYFGSDPKAPARRSTTRRR